MTIVSAGRLLTPCPRCEHITGKHNSPQHPERPGRCTVKLVTRVVGPDGVIGVVIDDCPCTGLPAEQVG